MLKYYYHCVLKLKGVYGARQIRSHPKRGTRRSSESAVLSLGWFVFSRKGASTVLLQLKGRRWPRCLIIQNWISVHPSVVSVSLPQLCLVSWGPCPLWLNVFRGECFAEAGQGGQGVCCCWYKVLTPLSISVSSFTQGLHFPCAQGPGERTGLLPVLDTPAAVGFPPSLDC